MASTACKGFRRINGMQRQRRKETVAMWNLEQALADISLFPSPCQPGPECWLP